MKKQLYTIAALLVMGITANAQVGIGTTTPDASSMLDIKSTTAGFLMPRMTTANRTAIASPAAGLQVFDTTTNTIWFFDGTAWKDSGTGTNIYNSNGALTSNRSVNMADKNLQFNSTTGTFVINTAAGSQAFTQTGAGVFGIDAPNVSNGRFVVLENGNVGIGKTLPAYNLSIVNNGASASITGGAVTNNALNISNPTGGKSILASMSAFTTGGVAKEIYLGINPNLNSDAGTFTLARNAGGIDMTMDLSTGNVGIGAGTAAAKLDVAGNIKITDGTQGAGKVLTSDANGLASWTTPSAGASTNIYNADGTLTANRTVTMAGQTLNFTGGNVGVGTSAPQVPLEVSNYSGGGRGRIMLSNYNSGAALGAGAYIGDVMFSASDGSGTMPSSTGAVPNISGSTTEAWSSTAHGSSIGFRVIPNTTTSAITAMTIDHNGRIGIGTTTPAANVEVADSNPFMTFTKTGTTGFGSNLGGYAFRGSNGAGTNVEGASITAQAMETWTTTARGTQFVLTSTSLGTTTIRNVVLNTNGGWMPGVYNATTNANQTLGTTTNRWSTAYLNTAPIVTSDGRLKTNIKNASYGLADVMKMRPVTYNWKTDPDHNHMVGFIAQEMEKIIPEAVEAPKNDSEHYGVRYEELIPVLTKAIQEQQAEIEAFKNNNAALEAKNTALESRLEQLEKAVTALKK